MADGEFLPNSSMRFERSFDTPEILNHVERNTAMLTVCFSVLLVGLGVTMGLGLPNIGVRRETMDGCEELLAAELLRQREIIADYEATIHAYRVYAQNDPELAGVSR
jgi:hypothetical protein